MNEALPPPLLVTDDDALLEDLLRLCAAAGVTPEVARAEQAARRAWAAAAVVIVGADLARRLAHGPPPRRTGVHVVARGDVPDLVFRWALDLGAEDVAELGASEAWLAELLTEVADGGGPRGTTIGVLGGSGGVGASVLAASVAVVCGRSSPAVLVDADPLGAGLDRLLGMERVPGVRWDAVAATTGRLSGRSLRESLPRESGVGVLTWSPERRPALQAFAVREVLAAARRAHGVVVVDLPRHPDPVADEVLAQCDHVVVLAGTTVPAVTAASRVVERLQGLSARPHLVVRGRGGVEPAQVAGLLGLPLAAVMSDQRGVDEAIDLGAGPLRYRRGPLARAARDVVAAVLGDGERAAA